VVSFRRKRRSTSPPTLRTRGPVYAFARPTFPGCDQI
jgi:hypothetical protein